MEKITLRTFIEKRGKELELVLLNKSDNSLDKIINNAEIFRPGLALTGFFERFASKRIQVLGETEITYLETLSQDRLQHISQQLFSRNIPLVIVTKGILPPTLFIDQAEKNNTAVLSSKLKTTELTNRLSGYLDHLFAPSINVHGTLVDVYGVGLLYTGKSGIGKSEIALDLIERGHRLVADDVVKITRTAADVIIGTGSEMLGHHMEVRGIGIIDIEELFGIRSIRLQKRIEVEVNLAYWSDTESYERLGIEDKMTAVLGVEIPIIKVPISPGKNITVISEVIAMNHMLKVYGENSALEFTKKLSQTLTRQSLTKDYLESDFE